MVLMGSEQTTQQVCGIKCVSKRVKAGMQHGATTAGGGCWGKAALCWLRELVSACDTPGHPPRHPRASSSCVAGCRSAKARQHPAPVGLIWARNVCWNSPRMGSRPSADLLLPPAACSSSCLQPWGWAGRLLAARGGWQGTGARIGPAGRGFGAPRPSAERDTPYCCYKEGEAQRLGLIRLAKPGLL